MHYAIFFESSKFDIYNEIENPISQIHGISVGEWLSPLLVQNGISVTEIEAEDWGWYLDAKIDDQKYLVGFIALPDKSGKENPEIIIQVEKKRTLLEILSFRNKMTQDDRLLQLIHDYISNIEDVKDTELSKIP